MLSSKASFVEPPEIMTQKYVLESNLKGEAGVQLTVSCTIHVHLDEQSTG